MSKRFIMNYFRIDAENWKVKRLPPRTSDRLPTFHFICGSYMWTKVWTERTEKTEKRNTYFLHGLTGCEREHSERNRYLCTDKKRKNQNYETVIIICAIKRKRSRCHARSRPMRTVNALLAEFGCHVRRTKVPSAKQHQTEISVFHLKSIAFGGRSFSFNQLNCRLGSLLSSIHKLLDWSRAHRTI